MYTYWLSRWWKHAARPARPATPRNTFAEQAESYARARPRYPADLFRWIYGQCEDHGSAWDCATGNGQAAVSLATHFVRVDATDISAQQIAQALPHPRVCYAVASAEASGLPGSQYDLVTVAQALHWFRFEQFWREVRRVARPKAFFCAWAYDLPETTAAVDRVLIAPLRALLEPFWGSNNRLAWNGYRIEEVGFPFAPVRAPRFAIEAGWTLAQLIDYLMTWSAFKRSRQDARARLAIQALFSRAGTLLDPDAIIQLRMPLNVLAGRIL
jgi:Methyltransferase domain